MAEHGLRGLAVSSIAWERSEDEAVATMLRAEGCRGVELAPTKWRDRPTEASIEDAAAHRAWWEERGLRVVAFQALLFGRPDLQLFADAATRRDLLDYLRRVIDLAERFGARALVFGSPKNRARGDMPMDEAIEIAVPFFRAAGEHAAARDTTVCIEANPPSYGCDFVTTTADAVELCRLVDHHGFRVHGDLGGITITGEDPARAIRAAAPYLGHFHVSEPDLAEIGTRGADLASATTALHDVGYDGWLSIEMRSSGDQNVERLRRAVQAVTGAMRGTQTGASAGAYFPRDGR